jgi:hypothetical protein
VFITAIAAVCIAIASLIVRWPKDMDVSSVPPDPGSTSRWSWRDRVGTAGSSGNR